MNTLDYELARARLKKVNAMITDLQRQATKIEKLLNHYQSTGDFEAKPDSESSEEWIHKTQELIKDVAKINETYNTYKKVLTYGVTRLRNVYGVVIEQMRKDFSYKYDIGRRVGILEAISDDDTVRDIFFNIISEMMPSTYWSNDIDDVIKFEGNNISTDVATNSPEDIIRRMVEPLAEKMDDNSKGFNKTYRIIYNNMDCHWGNLQTRYMNSHNTQNVPSKLTIVANNPAVFRKFKQSVKELLDG